MLYKLNLVADENIPSELINLLRKDGHDVLAISEDEPSISDDAIISLAKREKRVLITFDKHFANILLYPPKDFSGIIRIRIHPPLVSSIWPVLKTTLAKLSFEQIDKNLIVLEKDGFRIRK